MAEHEAAIEEGFSARAERARRAGDLEEARRIAVAGLAEEPDSLAGRMVLALILLDLGEAQAARYELVRTVEGLPAHDGLGAPPDVDGETWSSGHPPRAALRDEELDAAFAEAQPVSDEMRNVNDVAEAVLRDESLVEPEEFDPLAEPAFATETMATLLEGQGDASGAHAIRTALGDSGVSREEGLPAGERQRLIATLEGWLENLRKGKR